MGGEWDLVGAIASVRHERPKVYPKRWSYACLLSCKRQWNHEGKIGRLHLVCRKEGLSEPRICLRATPWIDAIPSKNLEHFRAEKVDAMGLGFRKSERDIFPEEEVAEEGAAAVEIVGCEMTELKLAATAIIVPRDQPADDCIIEGVCESVIWVMIGIVWAGTWLLWMTRGRPPGDHQW